MAAKVRRINGAWWLVIHYQGKRRKRRVGSTAGDKREAETRATRINGRIAAGIFSR